MILPGATADTGLPIGAGRSIPLWNVPASGLLGNARGPNGDDTQAGTTGGRRGTASEPPGVAPWDNDEPTRFDTRVARATAAKLNDRHLDIVLKPPLLLAHARYQIRTERSRRHSYRRECRR